MFRYSPYWVKPIIQDPPATAFGGALVYLDYGYIRPDETNKLVSIDPNELAITERLTIKGIDSTVNLNGNPATIIHDFVNDNIVVIGTGGLSSFDPRYLTLNWNTPLTGTWSFCGNHLQGDAITDTLVWIRSGTNIRSYNLLTGALVNNITVATTQSIVGGTNTVSISASACIPISDTSLYMGFGFINAHTGGVLRPYQAYRLDLTALTTYTISAVPGIPGDVNFFPNFAQAMPLTGFDNEIIIFMQTATATTYGQPAAGKLNMLTGEWVPIVTSPLNARFVFNSLQLDSINLTSGKLWFSGSKTEAGVTTSCLMEFSYPEGAYLGSYGGRLQADGTATTTSLSTGNFYSFYVIGSYIYALTATAGSGVYLWDVGSYNDEPLKVLPMFEGTKLTTVGTNEETVFPRNIYFPKIPVLRTVGTATYSNVLALRPSSKIIRNALPGLQVPAIAATLNLAVGAVTVDMWQKLTWIAIELDGINTAEIQIVNDSLNESAVGWLYDSTGKQVTYNKAFPILLGDSIQAGTYYLVMMNIKGDTTSLTSASNYNFRITVNNSPAVIRHQLTIRLAKNFK